MVISLQRFKSQRPPSYWLPNLHPSPRVRRRSVGNPAHDLYAFYYHTPRRQSPWRSYMPAFSFYTAETPSLNVGIEAPADPLMIPSVASRSSLIYCTTHSFFCASSSSSPTSLLPLNTRLPSTGFTKLIWEPTISSFGTFQSACWLSDWTYPDVSMMLIRIYCDLNRFTFPLCRNGPRVSSVRRSNMLLSSIRLSSISSSKKSQRSLSSPSSTWLRTTRSTALSLVRVS